MDILDQKNLKFDYDAFGQRIAKHTYSIGATPALEESTYYVRDAQGNIMASYRLKAESGTGYVSYLSYKLIERPIYGSSRIGLNGAHKGLLPPIAILQGETLAPSSYPAIRQKLYELSNHLGNVMEVVSDAKFPINNLGTISGYNADIVSYNDYLPFGAIMPGRTFSSEKYRFGFGGHEKNDEVSGSGNSVDMGDRWLDTRLGRTPKTDTKAGKYPDISPYAYALNSPIQYTDPDGKVVVDPKTGEQVVKVDGQWKTASGGAVSKEFIKNTQPVLDKLTASKVGTLIYDNLQAISTKVTIDLSDKDNKQASKEKGSNSEWHATMDEAKNADGLYKAVTITPNMENIEKKAAATGVDGEEKFLQTLSVEAGHIGTKEQINKEAGFENETASPEKFAEVYNPLLNQAIRVGKEYRKEKGIPIEGSSNIPITGPQKSEKGAKLTLEKDNQ